MKILQNFVASSEYTYMNFNPSTQERTKNPILFENEITQVYWIELIILRSMKTKDQGLEKFDCEPMKHLAPMCPPPFPKVLLMLTVHGLITFPN